MIKLIRKITLMIRRYYIPSKLKLNFIQMTSPENHKAEIKDIQRDKRTNKTTSEIIEIG